MGVVRRRVTGRVVATVGWASLLLGSGCTDGPAAPSAPRTPAKPSAPSPSVSSPVDPASVRRGALDAYRGMWSAYQEALRVPDPASAALGRYATGDALTTLTSGLRSVQQQGLKGVGVITVAPRITSVGPVAAPTEVEITDCLDDSRSRIVRASPGSPYNDPPGGRRLTRATVTRQTDGGWKVSGFGVQAVGTC